MGCVCFETRIWAFTSLRTRTATGSNSSRSGGKGSSQTIGGRLAYADLLRCTAMLAVIVVHITGGALEASPVGTPDFMVLNVYDG